MRANCQAAIWRHALVANPEVPPPQGNGWLITDDQLDINSMSLPPAPEAVLELILCGCSGTVHARQMLCPVQNLASAGMHVRILTTTCGRTEKFAIVLKRANYHSKCDKYSP